jgi:hypothetical protein
MISDSTILITLLNPTIGMGYTFRVMIFIMVLMPSIHKPFALILVLGFIFLLYADL